jgi:hypothetical protein
MFQQPHEPPQHPPPDAGPGAPPDMPPAEPPMATVDSSFTVSPWPAGQSVFTFASLIGRCTSKVSPQARHRYS